MARSGMRLTVALVRNAVKPGRYPDGWGLYLKVGPTGSKSWIYRYRRGGRLHDIGLGPVRLVTLQEARAKALGLAKARLEGNDPAGEKASQRSAKRAEDARRTPTFAECAERYLAAHGAGWRGRRSVEQWRASLEVHALPILGAVPVDVIDVGLVLKAVEPIWLTLPPTARLVRQRVEAVLDWAKARGYRSVENPARWKGHLENLLAKRNRRAVQHFAALPYAEMPVFLARLRERQAVPAKALELTILTACRRNEAIEAKDDEFDLDAAVWTIPGARTKSGRPHRIPLSDPAVVLLRRLRETRTGEYVFSVRGNRPLGESTIRMFMQAAGLEGVTTHGFRSSFRDWAAERTNFPSEVAEEALGHLTADETERAYRRTDFFEHRRRLMAAWAEFCGEPAMPTGEVIAMAGRP
jgi:integrase